MMENLCREDQETIREFLVESHENLSRLDRDLIELEKHPQNAALLGNIFRTFHTIKGACSFLGFSILEKITHQAETLLSQLRDGQLRLDPELVSLILETVDATRTVLASIEATGAEGDPRFDDLTEQLRSAARSKNTAEVGSPGLKSSTSENPTPPATEPSIREASSSIHSDPVQNQNLSEKREIRVERRRAPRGDDDEYARSSAAEANIRVGIPLLDRLMELVGELAITRNQVLRLNAERGDTPLNAASTRLTLITSELQQAVMKMRMQPIGVAWSNLPRVVRDMAVFLEKHIELKMDGAETELDRTIIEAVRDPLIHLVRNSCDHGIEKPLARVAAGKPEQGIMTLRASREGGRVSIEVTDDGAGIDVERVKQKAVENGLMSAGQAEKLGDREALHLILLPGFSLAPQVTNLSGRGVGMDVVNSNIEKIGGTVDVFSRLGEGTTVLIRIPLASANLPGFSFPVPGKQPSFGK
jgi:two-component system chemotaxis sensor kinase CheA